ncbi:hypothetical protein D3C71_1089780 [compost metagenome]
MQAENAIRPVDGQVDVVDGDHHQQALPGEALEQPQQGQLMVQIQSRQGLIQQQHPPIGVETWPKLQQGAGDQHPLLLTAGEAAEVPRQQGIELQRGADLGHRPPLCLGQPLLIQSQAQHLEHRNMEQLGLALGQHGAAPGKLGPAQVSEHFTTQQHGAFGGQNAGQGAEQSRLAAAVGAEQGHQLAPRPGKIQGGEPRGDPEGPRLQQPEGIGGGLNGRHRHLASAAGR